MRNKVMEEKRVSSNRGKTKHAKMIFTEIEMRAEKE